VSLDEDQLSWIAVGVLAVLVACAVVFTVGTPV